MKKYTLKKSSITKSDNTLKENQSKKICNDQNQFVFIKQKTQNSKASDIKLESCLDHQNNSLQIEMPPLKFKDMNKNCYTKGNEKNQHRFKAISFTNNIDYQQSKNINLITPRNHEQRSKRTNIKKANQKTKTSKNYLLLKYLNIWRQYFKVRKQCFIFDELSYSQMIILLNQLSYIRNDCESKYNISFDNQKQELKKIYQLWIFLTAQNLHVRLLNLVLFLMSFEKNLCNVPNIQEAVNDFLAQMYKTYPLYYDQNSKTSPQNIFIINNNLIFECDTQKEDFYKQFQVFKINKLSLKTQNSLKLKTFEQQNQTTIGSILSPKSNQLALTYRKQLLKKLKCQGCQIKNQNITVFDILTMNSKFKNSQPIFQQIQTKTLKIQTKIICLSDFKQKLNQLSSPKFHHEKMPDQIAFEKQKEEYTFRPRISRRLSRKSSTSQIKNLQKMAIRMKTARDIKEDKKNLMNKGWACKKPNLQIQINKQTLIQINKKSCQPTTLQQRRNTLKLQQEEEIIFQKHYEQDQLQLFQSKQITQKQQPTQKLLQKQIQKICVSQPNFSQNYKEYQTQNEEQYRKKTQFDQQSTTQTTEDVKRTIKNYLKIPILYVDVNIQQGKKQRIVIFQDDSPKDLATNFGKKHNLPQQTILRLQEMLIQQISTILVRIDEETDEDCSIL